MRSFPKSVKHVHAWLSRIHNTFPPRKQPKPTENTFKYNNKYAQSQQSYRKHLVTLYPAGK